LTRLGKYKSNGRANAATVKVEMCCHYIDVMKKTKNQKTAPSKQKSAVAKSATWTCPLLCFRHMIGSAQHCSQHLWLFMLSAEILTDIYIEEEYFLANNYVSFLSHLMLHGLKK